MQISVRSSVFQKIQNLFTSASYVWLKQISIRKTSINGCFQIRIFYCVLVNFSEKYSILAVSYLFTRKTSTSCEISWNLVKTVLYLKPVSLRVLVFLAEFELVNVGCIARSSPPQVFLQKAVLKICSKFTGEQPCGSVITIKLQSLLKSHVCFPLNLLYIFRTPFYKNTYEGLLLYCPPCIITTKQPGECLNKIYN